MCRLTAYIGSPIVAADLVTRPNHSIIRQSFAARERLCETHSTPPCINGDGFGIGWYSSDITSDPEPCIYRSTRPAWNDENLMQLSEKIQSHLLFAHVRAASPGSVVAERLCHPFRCGRYLFMHNGNIGGFDRVRRKLMDRLNDICFEFAVANGASDTVICFALFLNTLEDHMAVSSPDQLRKNAEAVVELIVAACKEAGVQETSLLNFVISDGLMLLCTRYVYDPKSPYSSPASLYFGAGTGYERKKGSDNISGEYSMSHTDRRIRMVIATSEPLSDNHTDWVAVPPNNILVVTPDLHLLLAPIGSSGAMSLALENIMSMERFLPNELKNSLGPVASRAVGVVDSPKHNGGRGGGTEAMHRARHVILGHSDSALALAVSDCHLFSGSQDGSIRVWNIESFTLDHVIQCADDGYSVLAIVVDHNVLYTTSSDNKLRAWDLTSGAFNLLGMVYCEGMGHPISLAVSDEYVYLGFQDTSVRIVHGPTIIAAGPNGMIEKFHPERLGLGDYASHHCGPVTALTIHDGNNDNSHVVSGAGDGFVKVWSPTEKHCISTLQGHHGSVLTLVAGTGIVISGSRDSTVKVWDMESFSCRRTLRGHNDDVLSLAIWGGYLFSGSADGKIVVWRLDTLTYLRSFKEAEQSIQSLVTGPSNLLFSGLTGGMVLAWDMPAEVGSHGSGSARRRRWGGEGTSSNGSNGFGSYNNLLEAAAGGGEGSGDELMEKGGGQGLAVGGDGGRNSHSHSPLLPDDDEAITMEECLTEFISYQSVSVSDSDFHKEECWRCAKFMTSLLERMGASVKMVSLVEGRSPVVLARFGNDPTKPTVTLYGHYDVVPATELTWKSNPFSMMALNGYLYGRGVTDNKGPIMAMIFALKEMKEQGKLDINAVLLMEGEEENSSDGFRETVLQNLHWFRGTSLILQANSTWIADDRPCLTYGMRGAIHLEVRVHGPKRNLHSGIDGGAVVEPLNDLVGVLSTLVDSRGMVLVPEFYTDVEEVSTEELELFDDMNLNIDAYKASLGVRGLTCSSAREVLAGRWRQPTLSINQVETSNFTDSYSILPKSAKAKISVRTVPKQNPERIVELIRAHLKHEFGKRRSPNDLFIEVKKVGDWWYGDRGAEAFRIAEAAIADVWGQPPLYVREGGTMPITSFLEELLKAPAIHLPLGQSTDNAHLPNERIRYLNLTNGKEIIKKIFLQVGGRGRRHTRTASNVSNSSLTADDPLLLFPNFKRGVSAPVAMLGPIQTEPVATRPTVAISPCPTPSPQSCHATGGLPSPSSPPPSQLIGTGSSHNHLQHHHSSSIHNSSNSNDSYHPHPHHISNGNGVSSSKNSNSTTPTSSAVSSLAAAAAAATNSPRTRRPSSAEHKVQVASTLADANEDKNDKTGGSSFRF